MTEPSTVARSSPACRAGQPKTDTVPLQRLVVRLFLLLIGCTAAAVAHAQIDLYEHDNFEGRSFRADQAVEDLGRFGFNDRASSVWLRGNAAQRWEVCEDRGWAGRCVVLSPGRYASLTELNLNDRISSVRPIARDARTDDVRGRGDDGRGRTSPSRGSEPQLVLYAETEYRGPTLTARHDVPDMVRERFNDRAASAVVIGGPAERWEVCEDSNFRGRCTVLRTGRYPTLAGSGLDGRISSVRLLTSGDRPGDDRFAPVPGESRGSEHRPDYRRHGNEALYQARVTAVRAVVDEGTQRCWVEPQQVETERSRRNIPGALIGAVLGGVLGHQVGGGTGKDVATGVGAVAGAVIGSNVGRGHETETRDVRRCDRATPAAARPSYWDVSYDFRGQSYRAQLTEPPGETITVNGSGEPRI